MGKLSNWLARRSVKPFPSGHVGSNPTLPTIRIVSANNKNLTLIQTKKQSCICLRISTDRMQVYETCDVGSIPTGDTNIILFIILNLLLGENNEAYRNARKRKNGSVGSFST
jgi:hypothetical protein